MYPQDTPDPDRLPRDWNVDFRHMECLIAPPGQRWLVVLTRGNCCRSSRPIFPRPERRRGARRRSHRRASPTRGPPADPPGLPGPLSKLGRGS